jgi:raffinose/stachyose/melibiose transport system substrate-binding protein
MEVSMLSRAQHSRILVGLGATAAVTALTLTGCSPGNSDTDVVTLVYMVETESQNAIAEVVAEDFMALNPDIKIEIEGRPAGTEGDNLVKTQLATGEMADLFLYNAGSLFQALNPTEYLIPLTGEDFMSGVQESFLETVTAGDDVFGVPVGSAEGGGILYNKAVYEDLGLEIPLTWDDFMANNEVIRDAGKAAVVQTYDSTSTWTSQLFVLGDYFNVNAAEPNFAADYTANKAKFATTPAALAGFEHLEEVHEGGFLNEDFGSATFEEGLALIASGDGVHYPMLSGAIGEVARLYPDNIEDVGFFAQPGESADSNGLTVWTSAAVYIPKTTENVEEAKRFLAYIASPAGCDSQSAGQTPTGPYLVEGCELPADVPTPVQDLIPYFETEGATYPALEFLSPVKGPNLENILVEVGSGLRSAADGAALYDEDVKKQAQQLGLEGW